MNKFIPNKPALTDRRDERPGTRNISHEHIDLSLAFRAWGGCARHGRAAVWRVPRRVRGALLCTIDRSRRFYRRLSITLQAGTLPSGYMQVGCLYCLSEPRMESVLTMIPSPLFCFSHAS